MERRPAPAEAAAARRRSCARRSPTLPDEQRRALLLAALFGYTAREIGAIEEIPLGTAKTRIRAAMPKVADERARSARSPTGGSR